MADDPPTNDDKPIDLFTMPTRPGERIIDKPELPRGGVTTDQTVACEMIAGNMHLKRGLYGKYEVISDEPAVIGGTDTAPTPMTYLAMATGF